MRHDADHSGRCSGCGNLCHAHQCKSARAQKAPAGKKREPTEEAPPGPVLQSAFSVGDRVHHTMFGDGKIETITDDKLTITFEGNVTKEIRDDFVTRKR